jgi:hypothetical protein
MDAKAIELRDVGTFIPMLAVRMRSDDEKEHYLIRRAGYALEDNLVLLTRLDGDLALYDPMRWPAGCRTYRVAHEWIREHWDEITSGDVVDVSFILGLSDAPKLSERLDCQ